MLDKTTVADDTGAVTEIQIETLAGDVRDALLTRFRGINMPWTLMTQTQQEDLVNGLDFATKDLVRAVVRLLTNYEFPRVVVTLGDVKIIGGEKSRIEAKVTAPNIADYRDTLGENVGDTVMMIMVDSETFMAARAPAKTDPDQSDLPLGDSNA